MISLDGHEFRAYLAGSDQARAGLVVIQEIFGLNSHVRGCCDDWAEQGYRVISPALFDRIEGGPDPYGIELGYTPKDIQRGQHLAAQVGYFEHPLLEVQACLASFPKGMPVGVVGYCWGGTLAWLTACRPHPAGPGGVLKAAVGYYGGAIDTLLDDAPQVPVMLHFGQHDKHISTDKVERIRKACPQIPVYTYDAGHGFNCEARPDYDVGAAQLALQRSGDFFRQHLRAEPKGAPLGG